MRAGEEQCHKEITDGFLMKSPCPINLQSGTSQSRCWVQRFEHSIRWASRCNWRQQHHFEIFQQKVKGNLLLPELSCRQLEVRDPSLEDHPKVQELRNLSKWSEGHVWVSPEMHGCLTGVFKNQIDWLPLNTGSVRPTQAGLC